MKKTNKIPALIFALIIIALAISAMLVSANPIGADYSPNTGDTSMFIFIALGVVAVGLLIFITTRRKK